MLDPTENKGKWQDNHCGARRNSNQSKNGHPNKQSKKCKIWMMKSKAFRLLLKFVFVFMNGFY